jgi:hypothetical protein
MPIILPITVDAKPIIQQTINVWTVENGVARATQTSNVPIVDLAQQSVDMQVDQPMTNFVLVNEETSMRIDVISQIALGSTIQLEKMLKFNDISNPFTIDVGDLLFVPDLVYANINMKSSSAGTQQKLDIRNQYIDPEKESKLDPTLGKFDQRNKPKAADPSKTAPPLPPNFANIGDKEIEIKGGKIYFGPNVSKNSQECDEPLTKSEFLAKLIKNRINK